MSLGNGPKPDQAGNSPTWPGPHLDHTSSMSRQIIENALYGFYTPEAIMARDIQYVAPGVHEITFVFPKYSRTLTTLGHVSGVQIQAALFEALYCAVAHAIMDRSFPGNLNLGSFRSMRAHYFLETQDLSFRKMLKEGDAGAIRVRIISFDETSGRLTFDVSGIVRGKMGCLRKVPEEVGSKGERCLDKITATDTSRQVIDNALGGFYRPESVMARHIQPLGRNHLEVTSVFPTYDRTGCTMDHVSGVQIQAALLESLYCAVAYSLLDGTFPANLTMESFRAMRADFLLFGVKLPAREKLVTGEAAAINVKIRSVEDIRIVRPFHKVAFDLAGSVRGSVECLLEVPVH